jgi:CheY-like chemotaxis protein
VQLSLTHRQVGTVTVVTCRGRLVSGDEADMLLKRIDDLTDVLRLTRLDGVLRPFYAEADAIASAQNADGADVNASSSLILCADTSPDVLAYLRGLLKNAGHRVVTVENLYDGVILLKTMRPSVVVMGAALHAMRATRSADEFHRHLPPQGLIVLPQEFSSADAGDAARTILQEITVRLSASGL